MSTLVMNLETHLSNAKYRKSLSSLRASFGNLEDFTQFQRQFDLGDEEEFEFSSFFLAHFRDPVDVEVFNDTSSLVMEGMVGIFSLPTAGRVKISVSNTSSNTIKRVVNVLFS